MNYNDIFEKIEESNSIAIFWHDRIDWDSLWSCLAMRQWWLNKYSDKIFDIFTSSQPSVVFDFLDDIKCINHGEIDLWDKKYDLTIILDSGNKEQLWDIVKNNKHFFDSTFKINIDHHISNTKFWDINFIDWNVSSTCEILYSMLSNIDKTTICEKTASYLLMGIMTDTQNFTVNNTHNTFFSAAQLMQLGWDRKKLYKNLYGSKEFIQYKIWGTLLDRLSDIVYKDLRVYYTWSTQNDIDKWELMSRNDPVNSEFKKEFASFLSGLKNASLICNFTFHNDYTKASFRSQNFDVNKFAQLLWWWGHKYAAGLMIKKQMTPDMIEGLLKDTIDKFNWW